MSWSGPYIICNLQKFIHEQPAFTEVEYSFKHALTQEVAYNSILSERRRALHGRIGAAMEKLYAERQDDHLPELAHHFSRSANAAKAVEYLLKAGQSAMQRSTSQEALDRLERGLKALENLPATSARDQQELAIRVAMTMPMSLARGLATADVEVNLKRARELCDQTNPPAALVFQVLNDLSGYYTMVANFQMARTLADQILQIGAKRGDYIATSAGHLDLGRIYVWTGEYQAAATSLEQGIKICEHLLPDYPMAMLRPLMFPLVFSYQILSWSLWILGFPEQALRQIDRLHALPERLRAKFQRAQILNADLEIRSVFIRDYRGAREKAETMIALARENGFAFLNALGAVRLGQAIVQEGEIDDGIKTMLEGTEAIRATGEILASGWNNTALPEAFLTAGRATEGLAAVNQAIAAADQLRICVHEAEAHRLKGELLLLVGEREPDAEAAMRTAIAIAQRQEARGWELRAATSLARLLGKQGRIAEAREVLAPVYNWFTEGFDTADLKDAKALLDELGA